MILQEFGQFGSARALGPKDGSIDTHAVGSTFRFMNPVVDIPPQDERREWS